ncbi:long-chain fatty acid--CoA ligase [Micromonospora purpureochromogenes]|uniref:acyl-CoA synthetase n=1 Tax=Micromonospora purpureochromogenes TaxID=47872 RepID=UPI0033CEE4C0
MYLTQPLHNAVQRDGSRPLTICGGRVRSVADSGERVSRLAAGLRALGVDRGHRVALLSTNSDRYHETLLAVAWADAVVVPLNSRWAADEVAFALADCTASVLIVDEAHLSVAEVVRGRTGVAAVVVMADGAAPPGTIGFEELIAQHEPIADSRRGDDSLLGIFYTGGTTGQPKGVMLTHANLFASAWGSLAMGDFTTPNGRLLHAAPMFHLADLATWVAGLLIGSTHVILDAFTPQGVLTAIEQYSVTDVLLVPTMVQVLADCPDAGRFDTSSLVRLIYGGSPMPAATLAAARKLFPQTGFVQAYGMTELAPVATLLGSADHDVPRLIRSAGRAAPHAEVRVVNAAGETAPTGEVGEIAVRGDHVMTGYWQRPEETARVLRDGWLFTGDAGYLDEEGYLFVVDRIKDMIITGDENVYSAEVENVLSQHPAVAACAVIGLPDARWGERVHAIIVPRDGTHPSVDELRGFCRDKLAGYKLPRSVEYVRSLPISAAGKVLKRTLRQERI